MLKRFTPQFALLAIICIIATYGYVKSEIIDANTTVNTTPTVIIDAGHGGFDGGAVAKDGTVEKDINLQISLKVSKMLQYNGYDVIMTRYDDKGTEDNENAAIASRKKSDLSNRLSLMKNNPDVFFTSHPLYLVDCNDEIEFNTRLYNYNELKLYTDIYGVKFI